MGWYMLDTHKIFFMKLYQAFKMAFAQAHIVTLTQIFGETSTWAIIFPSRQIIRLRILHSFEYINYTIILEKQHEINYILFSFFGAFLTFILKAFCLDLKPYFFWLCFLSSKEKSSFKSLLIKVGSISKMKVFFDFLIFLATCELRTGNFRDKIGISREKIFYRLGSQENFRGNYA